MNAHVLRAQAEALYAAQAELLKLACRTEVAARRAERDELERAEAERLLREARRWLGEDAREASA